MNIYAVDCKACDFNEAFQCLYKGFFVCCRCLGGQNCLGEIKSLKKIYPIGILRSRRTGSIFLSYAFPKVIFSIEYCRYYTALRPGYKYMINTSEELLKFLDQLYVADA